MPNLHKAVELRAYGSQSFGDTYRVMEDSVLGVNLVGFLCAC